MDWYSRRKVGKLLRRSDAHCKTYSRWQPHSVDERGKRKHCSSVVVEQRDESGSCVCYLEYVVQCASERLNNLPNF